MNCTGAPLIRGQKPPLDTTGPARIVNECANFRNTLRLARPFAGPVT